MSVMRVLGFSTLPCGCVVGRYREVATRRELSYIEEKGDACGQIRHRRNQTVVWTRTPPMEPPSVEVARG
jgi:hypothetical protein